ncbi:conserved hypothetical protein [Talaromyces stipitatus ATCC 10500]|uniref:Uncharacterized protein n=1 Tax=Talaromyces stipitatus (strain ATCC 10500 / CBS 375.48 / QM 6759 / NRRL 1006) TaxID=441959 RepID=B8MUW7_TALSN|nr:uncharacterized protein TSTA_109140 [Talaromyces stipitatus ATCC 10500]EED11735.1 conserved hypothetical protein [Talaromyces stipitatus ATCC 10500]
MPQRRTRYADSQRLGLLIVAQFATNLWICLDNLEVATRLLSPSTGSSQEAFESFRTLAAGWPLRERLPHTKSGSVQIRWVPGHTKIPENEAADSAAKEGAASTPPSPCKSSYASLKRHAKTQSLSAAQTRWQTIAPQTYQDLEITTSPKRPGELQLNRLDLGHIIAARTGHGDFADYHERFNHDDAHLLCRCGARKAPLHFFFCYIAKRRAPRPPGPPSEVISFLLGTAKGAQKLATWLAETQLWVMERRWTIAAGKYLKPTRKWTPCKTTAAMEMRQRVPYLYINLIGPEARGLPLGGLCPSRDWWKACESRSTAVKYTHTHTHPELYVTKETSNTQRFNASNHLLINTYKQLIIDHYY